jgi:hypothetical protein
MEAAALLMCCGNAFCRATLIPHARNGLCVCGQRPRAHTSGVRGMATSLWSALAVALPILVALLCQLAYWTLYWRSHRQAPGEAALHVQMRALKAEIARLSPVADFVEVSLKQRQMVKLEKSLAALVAARGALQAHDGSAVITSYVQPALFLVLSLAFYSTPVAHVPGNWLWPLSWFLALPGHPTGTISMPSWIFICHAIVSRAATALATVAGIAPEASSSIFSPAGIMGLVNKFAAR